MRLMNANETRLPASAKDPAPMREAWLKARADTAEREAAASAAQSAGRPRTDTAPAAQESSSQPSADSGKEPDTASPYLLRDGSPRYGIRTETAAAADTVANTDPRTIAREAACMTLNELALAALARRAKNSAGPAPLVKELKQTHREAFREAAGIVSEELGTQRKWMWNIVKEDAGKRSRDSATVRRNFLRICTKGFIRILPAALLSIMILVLNTNPLYALGAAAAAYILLTLLSASLQPLLRREGESAPLTDSDFSFLRESIESATFMEVLAARGVSVPAETVNRVNAGFKDMQKAVQTAETLNF